MVQRIRFPWHFLKSFPEVAKNVGPSLHINHILPLWYFCPNISLFYAILLSDFETKPEKS